jgi:hypothetical protein
VQHPWISWAHNVFDAVTHIDCDAPHLGEIAIDLLRQSLGRVSPPRQFGDVQS